MILLESKKKINNKLIKDLNNNVTNFLETNISISMSYVYFCDINSKFFDHTLFCKLLNADIISADKYDRKNFLLITPRQGVETPWESKAKDIFYACGINGLVKDFGSSVQSSSNNTAHGLGTCFFAIFCLCCF